MSSRKKKTKETPDTAEDAESVLLLYSGLEDAFIGTVEQYGRPPIACYSKRITISILEKKFKLTRRQAQEQYEFEYLQHDFEDATPCFLDDENL
tara:strand:+ start:135 stop:416 length:282 start_codon:yes stop_codon:yes gene_type:complete